MQVTFFGIATLVSEVQSENASSSIVVTEPGILKVPSLIVPG